MWKAKVEPMTETAVDDEQRLWKVAVYQNGEYMNNQAEGVTHEQAIVIARELQENFDEQNKWI